MGEAIRLQLNLVERSEKREKGKSFPHRVGAGLRDLDFEDEVVRIGIFEGEGTFEPVVVEGIVLLLRDVAVALRMGDACGMS